MMPGNARHENQSYLATKPKRIALAAKDTPLTNALGIRGFLLRRRSVSQFNCEIAWSLLFALKTFRAVHELA